jgi:transposase
MITPKWEELFAGLESLALTEHSYPYQYQDLGLIKLFVYAHIEGIKGFQTLQKHLELRADVVELLGLAGVPHRKTIAERFRGLPEVVSIVLTQLTEKFIETGEVDASIASVDSTLMHAKGNVWHKKQRDKAELPKCGNVDTEAHWGKNGCGEVVPALAGVLVDLTVGLRLPLAFSDPLRSGGYHLARSYKPTCGQHQRWRRV